MVFGYRKKIILWLNLNLIDVKFSQWISTGLWSQKTTGITNFVIIPGLNAPIKPLESDEIANNHCILNNHCITDRITRRLPACILFHHYFIIYSRWLSRFKLKYTTKGIIILIKLLKFLYQRRIDRPITETVRTVGTRVQRLNFTS